MTNNLKSQYIAIDGDDVGNMLRERIISNDIEGAALLSKSISEYFDRIRLLIENQNFQTIFCGGDSILATGKKSAQNHFLVNLPVGVCSISVGIGETPEFAYLALQLAKARGKRQIVNLSKTEANTLHRWLS